VRQPVEHHFDRRPAVGVVELLAGPAPRRAASPACFVIATAPLLREALRGRAFVAATAAT
jgi:hypothetical protein